MTLIAHCGARQVERSALSALNAPEATSTWYPLSHETVLTCVEGGLADAGFVVERGQYALTRNNARFFGTLDLVCPLAPGVKLAVGVRNSYDKSLPLGLCMGSRVMVCDNLAFSSDVVVNKKHTKNGRGRFESSMATAVAGLTQYAESEKARIERLKGSFLHDVMAESIILRAYEKDVISHRLLPGVLSEWREPTYEDFKERTAWSLFNAFTTAMGGRNSSNPQDFIRMTLGLSALFEQAV